MNPLIYRGVEIFEKSQKGGLNFFAKVAGVDHVGWLTIEKRVSTAFH